MELTATPDMAKTPSNVLHSVSAVELKREEMIKLPIQSEPKSKNKETRDYEWVKRELMLKHNVPEAEIAVATGSERELEALEEQYPGGIFSERCPVKYVITQKALAEGWDCAFAYVLVSMAGVKSATAVEQLLGRILRQPQAMKRKSEALNRSYAYVVSRDFGETAEMLRECLVQSSGFNKQEASEFVAARSPEQAKLDFRRGEGRFLCHRWRC